MLYLFWQIIGFTGGVIYCSFFEWMLHRHVMHRPWKFFRYPFQAHAVVHHQTFRADASYHLQKETDKRTVPMAWWNAPAIWLLHVAPVLGLQWLVDKPIAWGTFVALIGYYAAYEYMHWCMHVPRKRNIERSGIFFRLNGHHVLHHRYMFKNLNVVLPLFDLLFGTLIVRAPVKFAQVTGPTVPNVQPREVKWAA
jgi:hypothetical protein